MNRALAKLSRNNHRKHIIDLMPLICAVFGVQCYLMSQFEIGLNGGMDTGDLALLMGLGLITFISGLFWYNTSHHVLIYEDRILTGFAGFGTVKTIKFEDIASIKAPKEEQNFSSLVLKLKNGNSHIFYFVDFPKASKAFLEKQIATCVAAEQEDSLAA